MMDINGINLRVALIDSDYYTEKAIHAYLAWDRRTRALTDYSGLQEFWDAYEERKDKSEPPDAIILDVNNTGERGHILQEIQKLADIPRVTLVCLSHVDDLDMLYAAAAGGARAFLHKDDVRYHIASAVCFASQLKRDEFLYSDKINKARRLIHHKRLDYPYAIKLPKPLHYPRLAPRVRQAIELFAIEGMPAALIANEMNISEGAVRGYIKDAISALGVREITDASLAMLAPRELAFMKLTALEE